MGFNETTDVNMPPQHHCDCQLNTALYHNLRGSDGSIGWLSGALKVAFIFCSFMKRTRTGLLRSPWCLHAWVCQCRLISTFEPAGLFLRNLVWTPCRWWTPQRHIFHFLKIVILYIVIAGRAREFVTLERHYRHMLLALKWCMAIDLERICNLCQYFCTL
jgi:hypothetical protein